MPAETKQTLVAGLAATHGKQLRRFLATRVKNTQDIPDLIQEIYLRLLRIPDYEGIRSPEAYLFVVARHAAQQHMLRQSNTTSSTELRDMLADLQDAPTDPALEVSAEQSMMQLQQALQGLTPRARAAFLFHRRDGLTLEQIAAKFGVSRPMAKKYLAKALVQFRKHLSDTE